MIDRMDPGDNGGSYRVSQPEGGTDGDKVQGGYSPTKSIEAVPPSGGSGAMPPPPPPPSETPG